MPENLETLGPISLQNLQQFYNLLCEKFKAPDAAKLAGVDAAQYITSDALAALDAIAQLEAAGTAPDALAVLDVLRIAQQQDTFAYNGRELPFSWDELSEKTGRGDFSGIRVGDYKTIELTTGETVLQEVAGLDPYYNTGDSKVLGHHIFWVSRDCLKDFHNMNATNTNAGTEAEPNPYRASAMYTYLNTTVKGWLPEEVKKHLGNMRVALERRYSASGPLTDSNGWANYDRGEIFLLTPLEVFGYTGWGDAHYSNGFGVNMQLPLFRGSTRHIIKGQGRGGNRAHWWLAPAMAGSATDFCNVNDGGRSSHHAASTALGVPLCFITI